ncbi:di-heme oxidoredictase family protein [Photobacterium proteolyticum]|uniref:di-heme oxidoredictase family protein n=1 Tax=Photobacterium proteolyticum TaxID=1903952 RepID=UPI00095366A4|nr:di-heme oxidoredictase family protein [Photobacterium proteolyticum]
MGLTSSFHPEEPCTESQGICTLLESGGEPEVSDSVLDAIDDFLVALAVPSRRIDNLETFNQGSQIFKDIGCESCHRETLSTGTFERFPILNNQKFYAYTDLLLHDMGVGLSDGAKEGNAEPTEWRTPPLWGWV